MERNYVIVTICLDGSQHAVSGVAGPSGVPAAGRSAAAGQRGVPRRTGWSEGVRRAEGRHDPAVPRAAATCVRRRAGRRRQGGKWEEEATAAAVWRDRRVVRTHPGSGLFVERRRRKTRRPQAGQRRLRRQQTPVSHRIIN